MKHTLRALLDVTILAGGRITLSGAWFDAITVSFAFIFIIFAKIARICIIKSNQRNIANLLHLINLKIQPKSIASLIALLTLSRQCSLDSRKQKATT